MSIRRDQIDQTDFAGLVTGQSLAPIHPGEILREEFMVPGGMSANALALALHVPAPRINDVVRGKRGISADTALRLARYFGTSAEFWTNLQASYDLRVALQAAGADIIRQVLPLRAA
ncbi:MULTISPECIES: HigA family addiction module antitoxin [Pandoraea]|uniref:XRE family transcriptional regulator n=1 Tax=Pandoraea norimbergensis TaxID=93219 RepID=A0ABM7DM67_9BURK|nr:MULTISPECIES: HigA family addiction module antitoxin [Pandoraea]ALS61468.1 addiction module antidote protein, HigA family [Pandoraea norimbergensis]